MIYRKINLNSGKALLFLEFKFEGGLTVRERKPFKRKFRSMPNIPKPVKVGEEYDVEINEVGAKGDGIARVKNFVVFVPNTKKGEKAHIKIKEVRNRFAVGERSGSMPGEEMEESEIEEEEDVSEELEPEEEMFEEESEEEAEE